MLFFSYKTLVVKSKEQQSLTFGSLFCVSLLGNKCVQTSKIEVDYKSSDVYKIHNGKSFIRRHQGDV
jgi:hypothetical protein